VRGLLEIFHDFKFTIEENTPLEEDVALDPELLGRVFENLLAAYNPETQVTARKQTGSFYTPREIVDYMTGQALLYALREKVSELPDLDTRLPAALAHDDAPNPFNSAETGRLIAALDELKILDPACGSGAFPMGVLHRLVHLLGKLDPGNTRWKQRQLDKAAELTDHDIRDLVTADIEEAFAKNELGYGRKLYLIENCLYGVDIQPIAAQITKLRFFISLIVEQRTDSRAPNRGIRPLPNLETKIVSANSLIGVVRKQQQADFLTEDTSAHIELHKLRHELTKVRDDHFLARTPKKKAKCREADRKIRSQMSTLLEKAGMTAALSRQLAAWDPYDQNTHADFFDTEWMFGLTEGFDVVIGNPPYVRPHKLSSEFKEVLWRTYGTFEKKADLYVCFIELAVKLLRSDGTVSFIASNGFLRLDSFTALRSFLLRETSIRALIDFEEDVFESAAVKTCVLVVTRRKEAGGIVHCARPKGAVDLLNLVTNPIPQEAFEQTYMSIFDLSTGSVLDQVKDKMRADAVTVGEHFEISFGLKTGDDDRFLSKRASTRQHQRLLRGENVGRYLTEFADEYVWYVPDEMTSHKRTARPGTADRFEQPKILVRDTGAGLCCTFDGDSYYVKDVLVVSHASKSVPLLKKLTAVLNSKLLRFYYETSFPTLHVQRNELGSLPLRPDMLPSNACRELPTLVDQILAAKRADAGADTSAQEAEIDRHVYALYGLTPEEIKIVEGTAQEIPAPALQPAAETENWRATQLKRPLHTRQPLGNRYQPALVAELLAQAGLPVSFEVFRRAYWFLTQPDRLAAWVQGALPQFGAKEWQGGFTESLPAGTFFAHLKAMIQQGQVKLRKLDGDVCLVETTSQPAGIAHVVCDARLAILAAEARTVADVVPALSVAEQKELTGLINAS
jgi:adenine-specific DNA-methyltransferase